MFTLHSHIPYCRKAGMWPFGEEWLYEAMLESYIPLLDVLWDASSRARSSSPCASGGGPSHQSIGLTVGITPILLDQLDDDYMREGFLEWARARMKRAEDDRRRFALAADRARERQAQEYCERYGRAVRAFVDDYEQDVAGAFGELQGRGIVEIVTSAATHAYLPLLKEDLSIRSQLAAGCESYARRFGRAPRGIWLPECAYRPGLEDYLRPLGIEYFFVDTHAIEGGEPIGVASGGWAGPGGKAARTHPEGDGCAPAKRAGHLEAPRDTPPAQTAFRPYLVGTSSIACLGRNERVTVQVWSSWLGYPGDGLYREFHRKDDVSGLQYWRVTSRDTDLGAKDTYDAAAASARLKEHAAHFVGLVHDLADDWWRRTGERALIVAPYDTELFGHWWYEGVAWLGEVLRGFGESQEVEVLSAGKALDAHPAREAIDLPESSWGRGGKHEVWLNDETAWMWDIIHAAEARMKRLAALKPTQGTDQDLLDALTTQALREFFLLVSSDWPFLVTERQAAEYGSRRFREHAERFDRLMDYAEKMLEGSAVPVQDALRELAEIAEADDIFPWLSFSLVA